MSLQTRQTSLDTDPPRPMVFYDGGCPLCRREIAHYRRIDREQRLRWVDAPGEPGILATHGLSLDEAMAELHVLDATGNWQRGIDAFLVIWQQLPVYRWLAKLVRIPGLRPTLVFLYHHFAAWRYRHRCETGGCSTGSRTRGR